MLIHIKDGDHTQTNQYLSHAADDKMVLTLISKSKVPVDKPLRLFLVVRPETRSLTIFKDGEADSIETYAAPNDKVHELSIPVSD